MGAHMFAKIIYRGLPTVALLVVIAVIQVLAVSAFV
jgi:hypothetical protein